LADARSFRMNTLTFRELKNQRLTTSRFYDTRTAAVKSSWIPPEPTRTKAGLQQESRPGPAVGAPSSGGLEWGPRNRASHVG
jgi:hypothetical protein